MRLEPSLRLLGSLVCGAGGTTSNLFSHWSKGDLPLSITLTIISSLLSFGTLPLLLLIYGSEFTTDEVKIPYTNILTALALVIIPVGVGMSVKSWYVPPASPARFLVGARRD